MASSTLDDGQTIHLTGGAGNKYTGHQSTWKKTARTMSPLPTKASLYASLRTISSPPTKRSRRKSPSTVLPATIAPAPLKKSPLASKAATTSASHDMHLHYSVNGGPDHDVSLLKTPGAKDADGSYMLPARRFQACTRRCH